MPTIRPAHRLRHRHRRRLALLYAVAQPGGRDRRRDLLLGQRRGHQVAAQHPGRAGARRPDRHRGRDRPAGAARPGPRDHTRDARAAGSRLRRAAAAEPPGERPARRGRPRRRGASPTRRDHPRDARPADEPRRRPAPRAGPAPTPPSLGPHGRRLPGHRQHRADDRVEHPLRPGGGEDRVHGLRRATEAAATPATARARASTSPRRRSSRPDHVVALARRAGSRPDDDASRPRTGPGRDPLGGQPSRSSASSPTRSGSTWSSTPATTASTARSSTTRWPSRRPSIRPRDGRGRHGRRRDCGGTLTTGETVTDWRRVWGRPPNVDVACEADAQAFLRRFVERVGALAERRRDRDRRTRAGRRVLGHGTLGPGGCGNAAQGAAMEDRAMSLSAG